MWSWDSCLQLMQFSNKKIEYLWNTFFKDVRERILRFTRVLITENIKNRWFLYRVSKYCLVKTKWDEVGQLDKIGNNFNLISIKNLANN